MITDRDTLLRELEQAKNDSVSTSELLHEIETRIQQAHETSSQFDKLMKEYQKIRHFQKES